ncbi:MAG TPA: hypothetical protein VHF88_05905 [Thermoleophilaceae bacterium]|nr:hypothetical protein [Thermoleophilaceae bacterium]
MSRGTIRRDGGRLAVLLALLALSLGAAACGGSDDDEATAQKGHAAGMTGDEREIHDLYAEVTDRFYAKDAAGVCGLMTDAARRDQGKKSKQTCEEWFKALWQSGTLGKNKPYIAKLAIRGGKAQARVKTKNSKLYPVEFTREDGRWKVSDGF